jgi:proteic killer suppression protein
MAPPDMALPGLSLQQLEARKAGRWSVRVRGNWRVTFRFDGPDAA